jgi:hypothetical protein
MSTLLRAFKGELEKRNEIHSDEMVVISTLLGNTDTMQSFRPIVQRAVLIPTAGMMVDGR